MDLFAKHRALEIKGYFVNVEMIGKHKNGSDKVTYTGYVNDENGGAIVGASSCDDYESAFREAINYAEGLFVKEEK